MASFKIPYINWLAPNDTIIKNIGKDLGGEENIDSSPRRPKDLPPGFQEVLRL